ncbi:HEAT repeat domain-containing protein [Pedosphaera parvula]|uniref:HEAT repeat domain-containing protein n=1 Tax=Pedosphaera parvula TaxID=1032527 RepID=UPI0012379F6A|nr:HEAT repeat domain-containing protein [Pedosphaera parvula]
MRRKRAAICFLFAAAVGLLVLYWFSHEPTFQGKSLSFWMVQVRQGDRKERVEARNALHSIGKAAVPRLIKMLQARNSPIKTELATFTAGFSLFTGTFQQTSGTTRIYVVNALGELGSTATEAVPYLQKLADERDVMLSPTAIAALIKIKGAPIDPLIADLGDNTKPQWYFAANALADLETNAAKAVPLLCQALESTNSSIMFFAARALGRIRSNPQLSIPALVNTIKRSSSLAGVIPPKNIPLRGSIEALGEFEQEARSTNQILEQHVHDPDSLVRQAAITSLYQIMPHELMNPILEKALLDSDPTVQQLAKHLLKKSAAEAIRR